MNPISRMKKVIAFLRSPAGKQIINQALNFALPCIGVIAGFLICKFVLIDWLFKI